MTGLPHIRVVAALIVREGRLLVAERPPGKARALLWEFPGGKVESGETDAEALARECREELGVALDVGRLVWSTEHAYADLTLTLLVYQATLAPGCEPEAREAKRLAWLEPERLNELRFCPADEAFVAWIATGGLSRGPARSV